MNIIFDFAGVISPTSDKNFLDAFNFDPKVKPQIEGFFSTELFKAYQSGEVSSDDYYTYLIFRFPELSKEIKAISSADYITIFAANPKMIALAEDLKAQGNKIFIMTNNTPETAKVIMDSDYSKDFDGLIFSTDTHLLKPDVQAFALMNEYYKLDPSETIFIDDSKKNLAGAKKAGLHTIHFTSPENTIAEIEKYLGTSALS